MAAPKLTPTPDPVVVELLQQAARLLTGHKRRQFMAAVTERLCLGRARHAESLFGFGRQTVRLGQQEKESGLICLGAFSARGQKRAEVRHPRLEEDVRAVADAHAQADPQLRTALAYPHRRLSARAVREALVKEKGWDPQAVPAPTSMNELLNRLGYRLRAVAKKKPQKKRRPQT